VPALAPGLFAPMILLHIGRDANGAAKWLTNRLPSLIWRPKPLRSLRKSLQEKVNATVRNGGIPLPFVALNQRSGSEPANGSWPILTFCRAS
jgi:hypothetical protein